MRRKAQAAMEFLATYGWMVFMVLIAGGAMAAWGVYNTDDLVQGQCDMGYDFSCDKHVLESSGIVRVQLTNYLGEEVNIDNFTCRFEDDPEAYSTNSQLPADLSWLMGDSKVFECNVGVPLPEDSRETVSITLYYTKASGGFQKSSSGTVVDRVN